MKVLFDKDQERVDELLKAISWIEDDECVFDYIDDIPDEFRGEVESYIEQSQEWCHEHRDWYSCIDFDKLLRGSIRWDNDLAVTARVMLCEMSYHLELYDRVEELKAELCNLTYEDDQDDD